MTHSLAIQQSLTGLTTGTVQTVSGRTLLVAGARGLVRATRAEGCLLAPEPGDKVLTVLLDNGEAWVLGVLEKKSPQGRLLLPEQTEIRSGRLSLTSESTMLQAERLELHADHVHAQGRLVSVKAGVLLAQGAKLLRLFASVTGLAGKIRDTALHRKGNYGKLLNTVEDLSELRTGRMRVQCETSLRTRSESVDVKAEEHLDLDAARIRIG